MESNYNWTQNSYPNAIWTTDQLAYALAIDSDIAALADEIAYLNDLQAAAVEFAETMMNTSLLTRTVTTTYYGPSAPTTFGFRYGWNYLAERLYLPRGPILSLTMITDANGTIDSSRYQLQGAGNADFLTMLTGYMAPLTIVYEAGYGSEPANVPGDIKQAIRTHIALLHERKESATDRTITAVPHSLEAFYRSKSRTRSVH